MGFSLDWEPQPWIPKGEQSGLLTRIGNDGKRFVVRADEKLTAFFEFKSLLIRTQRNTAQKSHILRRKPLGFFLDRALGFFQTRRR
jgi:hypothetical protein